MASLAGCTSSKGDATSTTDTVATTENSSESGAEEAGGSYKIGVLMKTMSDTYSNKLGEAIQSYAEKTYSDCDLYLMDGQADIAKQISQAEDLIAKQVDVIILNPQDAESFGTGADIWRQVLIFRVLRLIQRLHVQIMYPLLVPTTYRLVKSWEIS